MTFIFGGIPITAVWFFLVNLIGINFPLMHLALILLAIVFLSFMDIREYQTEPSVKVYAVSIYLFIHYKIYLFI
jgi:hypothetical protein